MKRKSTSSSPSLGSCAIDAGSALLSAPLILSALGRKRTPVREVEAQIVTEEELRALERGDGTSEAEKGAAEPPPIAQIVTEDEAVVSAVPEVVDDVPEVVDDAQERAAEPPPIAQIVTDDETVVSAVPEVVDDAADQTAAPAEPDAPIEPDAPTEPDPATQPAAQVGPSLSTEEWTCEIAFWREHDEAVLYARSFHGEEEITIAESPRFPVGADGVSKQSKASVNAHERLCEDLAAAGWERVGRGVDWYSDRFRRDFSVAALNASLTPRIVFARRP
jgi:hypothetical protein